MIKNFFSKVYSLFLSFVCFVFGHKQFKFCDESMYMYYALSNGKMPCSRCGALINYSDNFFSDFEIWNRWLLRGLFIESDSFEVKIGFDKLNERIEKYKKTKDYKFLCKLADELFNALYRLNESGGNIYDIQKIGFHDCGSSVGQYDSAIEKAEVLLKRTDRETLVEKMEKMTNEIKKEQKK